VKYTLGIFAIVGILLTGMLGCDNLGFPKSNKKTGDFLGSIGSTSRGKVIGKVNNIPLTLEDLNEDIEEYNDNVVPEDKPEMKITTREQKINYAKNEMVRAALLYQEALNRGMDKDQDVAKALEQAKMKLLVAKVLRNEMAKVEVSSKDVEEAYNTYKEQLKEPEERQIREIVVSSEQDAKDVLVQLLQGADFATLAKEKSRSSSSKDGGDIGFIPKGKKFAQFDAVAFSDTLDVGKTSNIFKGPDGYYVIKLEAKRGGKQKPLSELYDDIKRTLTFLKQREKLDELVNKVSKTAKIEVNEGEIK